MTERRYTIRMLNLPPGLSPAERREYGNSKTAIARLEPAIGQHEARRGLVTAETVRGLEALEVYFDRLAGEHLRDPALDELARDCSAMTRVLILAARSHGAELSPARSAEPGLAVGSGARAILGRAVGELTAAKAYAAVRAAESLCVWVHMLDARLPGG